ncbi:MAG: TonB-dependent receptor plug domain-containing protein [Bdellovibrionota bacterium]
MRLLSSSVSSIVFLAVAHAQEATTPETMSAAETCSIDFQILEKGTRTPIADAPVYLLPDGVAQTTDSSGRVKFSDLTCQEHSWVINITGYVRMDIKQTPIKSSFSKIYIEKINQAAFETVVTDDKLKRDGSQRTLKGDQFMKAIGARGDPIIALENEPGVSGFGQEGGIILQGADPEDTRFYVNGHEVPQIFHNLGFSSIFIPDAVDSVELMPAGFGSEYGRTIGGNINLITKSPKTDRLHSMAYVDLLNAAALVQGPITENQSFWIGGRYSYLGLMFNLVTSDNVTFNQVPEFYDIEGGYNWQINDNWKFDLTGFTARDQIRLAIKDTDDPFFKGDIGSKTKFFRFIPRVTYQPNEDTTWYTSISGGRDYLDFDINNQYFDADINQFSLRSEWKQTWTKNFTTFVGTDSQFSMFRADANIPSGTFPNSEDDKIPFGLRDTIQKRISEDYYDVGFYMRTNIQTDDEKWLFSPNARFEYFSLTQNAHVSPRLEITRKLNPYVKVRANAGLYYQPPQPPELEEDFGNPNLTDPRAIHYSLGAAFDGRSANVGFWGDTTVFYKDLDNLVSNSDATITTPQGIVPERYNNSADGYVVGSQWSLNYHFRKIYTGLVYTILWSRKSDPLNGSYPSLSEQRHNLNMRVAYEANKKWTFSTRARLISGPRFTPVIDAAYDLDNDVYYPTFGALNSRRAPYFFQLDVRADRKWVFERWIMSLYVDVQNVLNRANAFNVEYNFDYSKEKKNTGIPILPTFGIKGEW